MKLGDRTIQPRLWLKCRDKLRERANEETERARERESGGK